MVASAPQLAFHHVVVLAQGAMNGEVLGQVLPHNVNTQSGDSGVCRGALDFCMRRKDDVDSYTMALSSLGRGGVLVGLRTAFLDDGPGVNVMC